MVSKETESNCGYTVLVNILHYEHNSNFKQSDYYSIIAENRQLATNYLIRTTVN